MADFNPKDRVRKMVQAIINEAKERASQIKENTESQFKIEKNKIINQEQDKIITDYKSKLENHSMQQRIERSSKINQSRLEKMRKRNEQVQKLKELLVKQIEDRIKDPNEYKQLLKLLIVQSMIKLMEEKVELRCRKADVGIIDSIKKECEQIFKDKIKKECNRDFTCTININKNHFFDDDEKEKNTIGGIVLSCYEGRIQCSNTLNSRIDQAFQEFLPNVREKLFPDYDRPKEQPQKQQFQQMHEHKK